MSRVFSLRLGAFYELFQCKHRKMGIPSEQQSNQIRLKLHAMVWLVLLVIITLKNDVRGQFAVINETNCTEGLLNTIDYFRVEGIVSATSSDIATYPLVVFSYSKSATSGFNKECSFNISKCPTTPPPFSFGCYCITSVPGTYSATFRRHASDIFSNGFLKVTWKDDTSYQLPSMIDECNAAALSNPVQTSNGSCTFEVKTDRLVTYCCLNTIKPCIATIEYRNNTVSGTPCATLKLLDGSEYETLTFSHTVCGRSCKNPFTCSPVIPVVECSCSCQVVVIVIGVVTGVGICAVAAYVLYLQMSKGASGKDKKHGSTTSQKVL